MYKYLQFSHGCRWPWLTLLLLVLLSVVMVVDGHQSICSGEKWITKMTFWGFGWPQMAKQIMVSTMFCYCVAIWVLFLLFGWFSKAGLTLLGWFISLSFVDFAEVRFHIMSHCTTNRARWLGRLRKPLANFLTHIAFRPSLGLNRLMRRLLHTQIFEITFCGLVSL